MDSEHIGDLIECSVCLDTLGTSNRVLPCQHTFCKSCLEALEEVNGYLKCPECRMVHHDLVVEDLPTNVILNRILEGLTKKKEEESDSDGSNSPFKLKVGKEGKKSRTVDQLMYSESEEENADIEILERSRNTSDDEYSPVKDRGSSHKSRRRKSRIEESDSEDEGLMRRRRRGVVDIDQPSTSKAGLPQSSSEEESPTRSSRRISQRRSKKQPFKMPSRRQLLDSIASPTGKADYNDDIEELRPRKAVNNLIKGNSRYNHDANLIYDSDEDSFIDDDYDYIDESSFVTTSESDTEQDSDYRRTRKRRTRVKNMDYSSEDSHRRKKSKQKRRNSRKKQTNSCVVDSDESDSLSDDSDEETSLDSLMDTDSEPIKRGSSSKTKSHGKRMSTKGKLSAKTKNALKSRRSNKYISESETESSDETVSVRSYGKRKSKNGSKGKRKAQRKTRGSSSDTSSTSSSFSDSSELMSSDSTPPRRKTIKRRSIADDSSESGDSLAGKRKHRKRPKRYDIKVTRTVKIRKNVKSSKGSNRRGSGASKGRRK